MNDESNTLTVEQRKALWLGVRRRHLTATDMGGILGLSKFTSRMGVWLDKMGLAEREDTERQDWGNRLQAAILMGYADRVGHPVEMADPFAFTEVPDFPILGASLDARWADDDLRPVDAKNVAFRKPVDWGEDGSDQIPQGYLVQLTVQMMATRTDVADLAVLFGGNKLATYRVYRDAGLVEMIATAADEFWRVHIIGGVEPAIDGSDAWTDYLSKRAKQTSEVILPASAEAEAAMIRLQVARTVMDEAKKAEAEASNIIKALIGEHAGIAGERGRVMWKQALGPSKVDWEATAKAIAGVAEMTDDEVRGFMEANTTRGAGSRRFLPTFAKEE
jgi:putative phage-type endonuclease